MSAPGNELRPAVKIVDVEAWIDNNRLAYWCQRCLTWHSNGFDPSEAAPILRCAPQCQRQSADQIRLVIQGIADADMLRRFARDDPPPGIEHPGRRLDAETVKALFLTQVRWIARLIRRKVPAERVADAVQYGEAT